MSKWDVLSITMPEAKGNRTQDDINRFNKAQQPGVQSAIK